MRQEAPPGLSISPVNANFAVLTLLRKVREMSIDPALMAAYDATDFMVFDDDGEWAIRIGEASAAIEHLLRQNGVTTATYVSAFNPRSVVLTDAENLRRHARLLALLRERGLAFAMGEGRDTASDWKPELNCIVFGTSEAEGLALAREFNQYAFVFLERGQPPRLVYCE